MVRAAAERILIGGESVPHAPEALQNDTNAEHCVRIVRLKFEKILKRVERIFRLAETLQHDGARAKRLGIGGLQHERPIEPRQGVSQIIRIETDEAQHIARDIAPSGEVGVSRKMDDRVARLARAEKREGLRDRDLEERLVAGFAMAFDRDACCEFLHAHSKRSQTTPARRSSGSSNQSKRIEARKAFAGLTRGEARKILCRRGTNGAVKDFSCG